MFPVSRPPRISEWRPAEASERYAAIDILRGLALFGVLLVNTETLFRAPILEHILQPVAEPGWADRVTAEVVTAALQFKAVTIFSFLFGAGIAIQAERARARNVSARRFLARRLVALLAIGLAHLLLIWNGDILALYAICGLLLVPSLRLRAGVALAAGVALLAVPHVVNLPNLPFPSGDAARGEIALARQVYAHAGYAEILRFRWTETWTVILPLLISIVPGTTGLMYVGAAAWRSGVLTEPERYRRALMIAVGAGAVLGVLAVALPLGPLPLASAYTAAVLLWLRQPCGWLLSACAALGQMALTNYLMQSIVLGFVFYGYGFGLFGRIGSAEAAGIAVGLYAAQLALSRAWLRHYRFGPFEWLWRSISYGHRQALVR